MNKAKDKGSFYLHICLSGSFIDGGFYNPTNEQLAIIRAAIDYDGEKLKEIISGESFSKTFGKLSDAAALKIAPKGYNTDHRHLDLLRLKSFSVVHKLTHTDITSKDFSDKVVRIYRELMPFNHYLEQAVSV